MAKLMLKLCAAFAVLLLVAGIEVYENAGNQGTEIFNEKDIEAAISGGGGDNGQPGPERIPGTDGVSKKIPYWPRCQGKLYHRTVTRGSCTGSVIVSTCSGQCYSSFYSYPNSSGMYSSSNCQCCKPSRKTTWNFPFLCPTSGGGQTVRYYPYPVYTDCRCSNCFGRYPTRTFEKVPGETIISRDDIIREKNPDLLSPV